MKFAIPKPPISPTLLVSLVAMLSLGGIAAAYTGRTEQAPAPVSIEVAQATAEATPAPEEASVAPVEATAQPEVATPTPSSKASAKPKVSPTPQATTAPTPTPRILPTPRPGYLVYNALGTRFFYPGAWDMQGNETQFNTVYEFQPGYTMELSMNVKDAPYSDGVYFVNQAHYGLGGVIENITVDGHEGLKLIYNTVKGGHNLNYRYITCRVVIKISETSYFDLYMTESTSGGNPPDTQTLHMETDIDDLVNSIIFL